ncbi:MAG: hypothetical protein ACXAEX_07820 [Promethearchaeota archaeon]|jgi:hypothetical protein
MQISDTIESIIFIIFYLGVIWIFLIKLILKNAKSKTFRNREKFWKWTFLAYFLLGFGDIFHLGFRIIVFFSGWGPNDHMTNLLISSGTVITSITMYYFYIAIFHMWANIYSTQYSTEPKIKLYTIIQYIAYTSAIVLLFLPYNHWYEGDATIDFGFDFRIMTAIPIYLIGFITLKLLLTSSKAEKNNPSGIDTDINKGNYRAALWYIVSFATYSITIFFVAIYPLTGLFMIPKTIAYLVAFYYHYKTMLNKG